MLLRGKVAKWQNRHCSHKSNNVPKHLSSEKKKRRQEWVIRGQRWGKPVCNKEDWSWGSRGSKGIRTTQLSYFVPWMLYDGFVYYSLGVTSAFWPFTTLIHRIVIKKRGHPEANRVELGDSMGSCFLRVDAFFFFKMCSSFTRIQLADPLKDSNSGDRAARFSDGMCGWLGRRWREYGETFRTSLTGSRLISAKGFFSYFLTFLATKELSSPANTLWRYIFR